jgi:hypothetical protein
VQKLVLLEPIVNGARYVDYLYRKQHIKDLMTGKSADCLCDNGYVNIEGYKTSASFIEQIENLDMVETAKENLAGSSVLIVQISNHSKIDPEIAILAKKLEGLAKQTHFENMQMPIFWERIPSADYSKLTQMILRWSRD